MPSPSAGATATVPASTPSNTCGPSVSATRPRSWNMSESDLPIDPAITIRAETSLVDPDTCKFTVSRTAHPAAPSRSTTGNAPVGRRSSNGCSRFLALPTCSSPERGDCGEGARRLLVRAESGDRNGSPDATAHGNTGHPRGYCQRRHTRADRRREPGSCSATPGPGSQPFHRCPRRADSIVDVRDGNLFIAMSGGCQGCSASKVTLRQGFEVMLRRVAPEITNIVDTTDHAAGNAPFYSRTG